MIGRIPESMVAYRRTPEFTEHSVPDALRRNHSTKAGVWGLIHVLEGSLLYRVAGPPAEEVLLSKEQPGVIEPEALHAVEPRGAVRFYVEFWREPTEDGPHDG